MAEDVRPEKIRKTQETLGKYIKKPPLTEKLLRKPPFRFLHDIVTSIMKDTGFLQGVFSPEELLSENIKDRDGKIAFLDKVIANIKAATGSAVSAKPSKIVAGMEVNKTLDLLLLLSKAVEVKMTGDRLAPNEKKKESKTTDGRSPRTKESKPSEKKSLDQKKKNEKDVPVKKTSTKEKPKDDKDKEQERHRKKKEENSKEEKVKELKADVKVNGKKEPSKKAAVATEETETSIGDVKETDDKRKSARIKDEGRRKSIRQESKEILEEQKEEKDMDKVNEINEPHSVDQLPPSSRRSSVHNEIHRKQSASVNPTSIPSQESLPLVNGDLPASAKPERRRITSRRERSSIDRAESKEKAEVDHKSHTKINEEKAASADQEVNDAVATGSVAPTAAETSDAAAEPSTKVASAKIKRPHSARIKPASSRQRKKVDEIGKGMSSDVSIDLSSGGKQGSIDNDSGIVGAPSPQLSIPSATSMRRSARPGSSRPGAPRARERGTVAAPEPTGPARPVPVIEDAAAAASQDYDNMVTVDRSPAQLLENDQLDSGIEVEAGKEGVLVNQILESKRELEESKVMTQWGLAKPSVNIEWEGGKKLRGQAWTTEVEKLREGIQTITKSSNPLGKLFDFLQEDVELMEREITMWRETNHHLKSDLANHQRETSDSLAVLEKQLEDITVLIENEEEAIRRVKTNIVLNNGKIEHLLRVSSP